MKAKWAGRSVAIPVALVLDSLVGGDLAREATARGYERFLGFAEEILWTDTYYGGLRFVFAGGLLPLLAGKIARAVLGDLGSEIAVGAACVGLQSMREQALASAAAIELAAAEAPGAPGDEAPVRAAVEAIATSFAKDVCGPLLYLNAAGVDGLLAYRAAVAISATAAVPGPATARFGNVPGRLGAVFGWLPSRVGALAVCAAAQGPTYTLYTRARRSAVGHSTPNIAITQAAFSQALEIGVGPDDLRGQSQAEGLREPQVASGPAEIRSALALAERAAVLLALWLMVADAFMWLFQRRRKRAAGRHRSMRRGRPS